MLNNNTKEALRLAGFFEMIVIASKKLRNANIWGLQNR